jgi:hypothetical protein
VFLQILKVTCFLRGNMSSEVLPLVYDDISTNLGPSRYLSPFYILSATKNTVFEQVHKVTSLSSIKWRNFGGSYILSTERYLPPFDTVYLELKVTTNNIRIILVTITRHTPEDRGNSTCKSYFKVRI